MGNRDTQEERKLYTDLAPAWPLFSSPAEYEGESSFYVKALQDASERPLSQVLELGSGGGNNASHMKRHFGSMVLVDLSPQMLEVSRKLNPDCEHIAGDMRTVRLGREFDAVFVHDAVCYMTTEGDLRRAMDTAYVHCAHGGAALFCPDHVKENFAPSTSHGGEDGDGGSVRYLEWTQDPGPTASSYVVDYAIMVRQPDGSVRVEHDRHVEGLFSRKVWLRLMLEAGFEPEVLPFENADIPAGEYEVFVGKKR